MFFDENKHSLDFRLSFVKVISVQLWSLLLYCIVHAYNIHYRKNILNRRCALPQT